jgi:hypothetical protein
MFATQAAKIVQLRMQAISKFDFQVNVRNENAANWT